jgi:hypothetical protein
MNELFLKIILLSDRQSSILFSNKHNNNFVFCNSLLLSIYNPITLNLIFPKKLNYPAAINVSERNVYLKFIIRTIHLSHKCHFER